ncbi:MAG: hypothetical protein O7D32_09945, partial [bacterium]|nr:hypothetical protein [bacterium]
MDFRLFLTLLAILWATSLGAAVAPVHLETDVRADSITVGERFRVVHRVSYPDSLTLVRPAGFDPGNCNVIDITAREHEPGVTEIDLELITVDLAHATIPGIPILFVTPAGDTLVTTTDPVDVPVRHLTGEGSEPRPLKAQWNAPRSFAWVAWLVAGLLLAAAAVYFFLRWRRRLENEPEPVEPALPPDFVALRELAHIETLGLLEENEFKQYYTLVVDVIRRYVENRYYVTAMDRTTFEILDDVGSRG